MASMVPFQIYGTQTEIYVNPLVASAVSDAVGGGSYVSIGDGRSVRVSESADDVQASLTAGLGEGGGSGVECVRFTPEFELVSGNSAIAFSVNSPWWVTRLADAALGRTIVTVAGQVVVSTLVEGVREVAFTLPAVPVVPLPVDDGVAGTWCPATGGAVGLRSGEDALANKVTVSASMNAGIISVNYSYVFLEP